MHRLTDFQHHIIANVHQRGNTADAATLQTLLHPIRRSGARIHVFNHAADKAAAIGRRINLHGLFAAARDWRGMDCRLLERATRQCGHFTRNAFDAQAVGTVRRDFQREHRIVQIQIFTDVCTDGSFLRQNVQAVHAVIGQTEFIGRTQHPVRHHAAHLGRLDFEIARQYRARQRTRHFDARFHIRRTAHNLHQLARPRIDLGNVQTVGIRMFFNGFHFSNYHACKRRGGSLGLFHFQAGHG